MSPRAAPPSDVDRFLDRLHDDGYGVGVRERLLAHALLARYAESGALPADPADRLRLLEPLLSRNEAEQRRFESIVTSFLQRPRAGRTRDDAKEGPGVGRGLRFGRRAALASLLALALIFVAALVWRNRRDPAPEQAPISGAELPDTTRPPDTTAVAADTAVPVSPIYVPVGSFPDAAELAPAPAAAPGWLTPLRWGLGSSGALLFAGLLAWMVGRRRRVAYLQGVRTDEELEEHVLRDPDPVALPIPDATVRPASRMLRQRIAGSREVLDLGATLHATMRAGGAIAARYRPLRQTPEYLVLVDRVSARDHQAAFHELLVDALSRYGVAVDLFHFDGSPAHGCWRPRSAHDEDGPGAGARGRVSVAQLSNRYGGHRLLVFGDAACAFEPLRGQPAAWTRHVAPFPSRAWFSPLPLASWGPAEAGVDGLGFLMLPAQPEALESLAEWLASDRATLRADQDWPGAYPPSLRGNAASWVARQAPPPPDAEEELLVELRGYLGATRFQWLCACAVFPAVSWPLTLSLGREILGRDGPVDPAALARGVAALGALPWFRYGRMPAWLRESLLDRVDPEQEERLRGVVERRLAAAMEDAPGVTLAEVAVRKRTLAWFRRRRGMARDVVLAGFLEKGLPRRLAQRMPKPLQRLLFRDGKVLYGFRPVVPAAAALLAVLCLTAAAPGVWEVWTGAGGGDRLTMEPYAYVQVGTGDVTSVAFSPDGQRVLAAVDDGTVRVWPVDLSGEPIVLRVTPSGTNTAAFSPDGRFIVTASPDEAVQVWRADGSGTPVAFREHSRQSWRQTFAFFSPDGQWIAAAFQDTAVLVWRADGYGEPVVLNPQGRVNSAAFSPDGQQIVIASSDSSARVWRTDGSRGPRLLRHGSPVNSAVFSPDGQRISTISADTMMWVWQLDRSSVRPILVRPHGSWVYSTSFSPDGQRIVTASEDSIAWVWRTDGSGNPILLAGDYLDIMTSAAFSPDGRKIVTVSGSSVRAWRADGTGAPIELEHPQPVTGAAFSPDGQRIVTASGSRVRLWGRRPGVAVNMMGCTNLPASGLTRTLADPLAQDTLFAPVVYSPAAWDPARLGEVPRYGDVRYTVGNARSQSLAATLVSRLDSLDALGGWTAVGRAVPQGTLSLGFCLLTGVASQEASLRETNIVVHYEAAADLLVATRIAETLRNQGGVVDRLSQTRDGGSEHVRYFYPEDLDRAAVVADVVQGIVSAAGFTRFEARLGNRYGSGPSYPRGRIEVWLPDLALWRSSVTVQIHSGETDRLVVTNALQGLGFLLLPGDPATNLPAITPTNTICYGPDVPLADIKRVALALIRAGVEIRLISRVLDPLTSEENLIQVGSFEYRRFYALSPPRARPYTVAEVEAATSFPLR